VKLAIAGGGASTVTVTVAGALSVAWPAAS
jgi:hypothetical protein